MIDNLTEAITHCREKAEELKDQAFSDFDSWTDEGKALATNCLECANEHKQLAEWLEELKARREQDKKGEWIIDGHHIRCNRCNEYICDTDREGNKIPDNFCSNCGADMRGSEEK